MDSSIDGDASNAPAFKLPVISFLSVNMCFLSGAWRREGEGRKTGTQTALTSNYTAACLGRQAGMSSGPPAGQTTVRDNDQNAGEKSFRLWSFIYFKS